MARLAFFGTPELAATCLQALLDQPQHSVVVVVCQPDKPSGRGHKLEAPPVKKLAEQHNIPVLQPATLKKDTAEGDAFFSSFGSFAVDLAVVAAYGRIVPKRVLALPPREFVNVHASLLPKWRGAAPIQRSLQAGDTETGVCLMHMVPELDAGDVYVRGTCPITDDDDSVTLAAKVADVGARLLREHTDALVEGKLPRVPQGPAVGPYAEMLKKEDARVPFEKTAREAFNHARAMVPWPGSSIELDGEVLKLFGPKLTTLDTTGVVPGTLVDVDKEGAKFACSDFALCFAQVQRPSKGRAPALQWAQSRSK